MGIRLAILVLIAVMSASMHRVSAHVALDYPVGGEIFIQGQSVNLAWHITAFHNTLNWDLFFSNDGGDTWEPIALNIHVDTLHYTWYVPFIETSQAVIRVIQDNSEMDYFDVSMNFSIVPNTSAPFLDSPANDITIACDAAEQQNAIQAWLTNQGGATATNFCGDLVWTHDFFGLNNACGATGNAIVTFEASDDCGSTFTIASITVSDNTPPDINTLPADMTVACDGQGNLFQLNQWLLNRGGAQATDACGNVTWSHNYGGLNNACGASGASIVIFTAADECGNTSTAVAGFTIADTIAPQISRMAQDTVIECATVNQDVIIQHWLNRNGGAAAVDACGDVSWTNNYVGLPDSCAASGMVTIIFTATDACGNSVATAASVSVEDRTPPIIEHAAVDTAIHCDAQGVHVLIQQWLANRGGATATDHCGNVSWTNNLVIAADSCSAGNHVVTFIATDECLNSTITTATLTLLDTVATSVGRYHEVDFTIFPNPVRDVLTIDFHSTSSLPIQIVLVDAYGREWWHMQPVSQVIHLPVSQFPGGLYFLGVKMDSGLHVSAVLIR